MSTLKEEISFSFRGAGEMSKCLEEIELLFQFDVAVQFVAHSVLLSVQEVVTHLIY